MKLKENSSKQKIRGAYYTPNKLANAMVQFFASKNIKTVLEPSCGDGVFLDSLKNIGLLNNINELEAVEIETSEAMKVSEKYKDISQVKVLNQDFFDFYKENLNKKTYDLIIGNPPYIRYQYLKKSQRDCQAQILTSHGMKSNKLINVWVAFMVSCVQLLSKKGKIAFVIPAEILQVAYAEDLRLYLTNHLSKITLITFKQLVFPNIEQEIIVFIGEKGNTENGIRIIEMDNLNEFDTLKLDANDFQPVQHVKEKWTKYFINNREIKLIQHKLTNEQDDYFDNIQITDMKVGHSIRAEKSAEESGTGAYQSAGLRFRGTISDADLVGATEVGFAVMRVSDRDALSGGRNGWWYSRGNLADLTRGAKWAYAYNAEQGIDVVYNDADGYKDFQLILTGLTKDGVTDKNLKDTEFCVYMWIRYDNNTLYGENNREYTYRDLGTASYASVLAEYTAAGIDTTGY